MQSLQAAITICLPVKILLVLWPVWPVIIFIHIICVQLVKLLVRIKNLIYRTAASAAAIISWLDIVRGKLFTVLCSLLPASAGKVSCPFAAITHILWCWFAWAATITFASASRCRKIISAIMPYCVLWEVVIGCTVLVRIKVWAPASNLPLDLPRPLNFVLPPKVWPNLGLLLW